MKITRLHKLILTVAAIALIALPGWAEARAGGGKSMGSRGSHTFQSVPNAQPVGRTTTAKPNVPTGQNGFVTSQPANGGNSFWRGMAGGFLGAGLFGMLFGHSFMGGYGGAGMLGGLFQMLLIGGIGYYLYNRFKGQNFGQYSAPSVHMNSNSASSITESAITITDADKDAFEQLLTKIQHNWSEGDLTRLRQFVTPEMLQYFSEELSANASRGLANKVEQVQLLEADIVQSWHEFDLDYVTAQLKWSALDYMVRLDRNPGDADYIASGSATSSDTAEEIWTFVRASGGNWLLSAIQQME